MLTEKKADISVGIFVVSFLVFIICICIGGFTELIVKDKHIKESILKCLAVTAAVCGLCFVGSFFACLIFNNILKEEEEALLKARRGH